MFVHIAFRRFLNAGAVPARELALVATMLLAALGAAVALVAGLISLLALALTLVLLIALVLLVLHDAHIPSHVS